MLAGKDRWKRNPYFHFHPMHNLYSLVMAVVLFGMMVLILLFPPSSR
jgi:hypothetical protein